MDSSGGDYRGTVSETISGKTCQKWTSQQPHEHDSTPANFPNTGLGDHNFCRNPTLHAVGAWCYTSTTEVRWETCNIGTPKTNCGKI